MKFLFPQFLWGLLGIFVFIFYKVFYYKKKSISSLKIWKIIINDKEYKKLVKRSKFKANLSFFLSIIIYILMIICLSNPIFIKKEKNIVICIALDTSPSMLTQIQGKEKTIFEKAKKYIEFFIKDLEKNFNKITILFFSYPPLKFKKGKGFEVLKFINRLKVSHIVQNFDDFFNDIRDYIKINYNLKDVPIYFFTDSAGNSSKDFLGVKKINLGIKYTNNIGIIDAKFNNFSNDSLFILSTIKNFSYNTASIFKIMIYSSDEWNNNKILVYSSNKIKIKPRTEYIFRKNFSFSKEIRKISLKLDIKDNFLIDNTVSATKYPYLKIFLPKNTPKSFVKIVNILNNKLKIVKSKRNTDLIFEKSYYNTWLIYNKKKGKPNLIYLKPCQYNSNYIFSYYGDEILNSVFPELIKIEKFLPLNKSKLPIGTIPLIMLKDNVILAYNNIDKWIYIGFIESNWEFLPNFPIFWKNYFYQEYPLNGNYYYELVNFPIIYKGKYKIDGNWIYFNFINEKESDNIGKYSLENYNFKKNIKKIEDFRYYSLRNVLIYLIILFLLILWKID